MTRKAAITAFVVVALLSGALFALARPRPQLVRGQLSAVAAASGDDDPRWKRVTGPRAFVFPQDHGPHPGYQTEWWYYTGNLTAEDGHELGFQLTFFRRGLDPEPAQRASRWATRNMFLAHFTISDITAGRFYASERFSRDGADLAGAAGEPYRVWLGDWSATGDAPQGLPMRLRTQTAEMSLDLQLQSAKPPALQGERGYSPKGEGAGNASYYYSLTRLATTGTVRVGEREYRIVAGTSWMDHEWGTSRLEAEAAGWDWFALQLSDNREITWASIRRADGTLTPASFGSITMPDGSTTRLGSEDVTIEVLRRWTSPRSGARYPAGWRLRIPGAGLDLTITPRIADQELPVSIVYWEGAVAIAASGQAAGAEALAGRGYVELTGYLPNAERSQGR